MLTAAHKNHITWLNAGSKSNCTLLSLRAVTPRRAVRFLKMQKNKPLSYCNEAVQSPNSVKPHSSHNELRCIEWRWQHPSPDGQTTNKKNTRPPFFPVRRSCFHVPGVVFSTSRLCSEPSERSTGENLQRRSAFILFIFPRNSDIKHTNGLCTKGGERRTEEAGESHPSFWCAHAQRSIPSAPRLVRLILRLSWTGRQMWALGLASPQGGDLDLKERSARRRNREGEKKEKLKSRVLGKRRQTAYQRLINPWSVICTVRPLRIGIKTRDARGSVRMRNGRRRMRRRGRGEGGWGGGAARWGLVSEGGREEKRLALDEMSSIVIKQEFSLSL